PAPGALPWGEAGEPPTAAFRVPAHDELRRLLERLGEPLVSTSVNRSGEPPLRSAIEIERVFGADLDGILAESEREAAMTAASTLADATVWPPRLLRQGTFDLHAALARWRDSQQGARFK